VAGAAKAGAYTSPSNQDRPEILGARLSLKKRSPFRAAALYRAKGDNRIAKTAIASVSRLRSDTVARSIRMALALHLGDHQASRDTTIALQLKESTQHGKWSAMLVERAGRARGGRQSRALSCLSGPSRLSPSCGFIDHFIAVRRRKKCHTVVCLCANDPFLGSSALYVRRRFAGRRGELT
jgi:hypothetical protein